MSLLKTDLVMYQSVNLGSTGGAIDLDHPINNNQMNNIFQDISHAQAISGLTEYKKFFIRNNNTISRYISAKIWIKTNVTGDANITLALGTPTDTDGSVLVYTNPTQLSEAIDLGTILPEGSVSIWMKRVILAQAKSIQNEFCELMLSGTIAS